MALEKGEEVKFHDVEIDFETMSVNEKIALMKGWQIGLLCMEFALMSVQYPISEKVANDCCNVLNALTQQLNKPSPPSLNNFRDAVLDILHKHGILRIGEENG